MGLFVFLFKFLLHSLPWLSLFKTRVIFLLTTRIVSQTYSRQPCSFTGLWDTVQYHLSVSTFASLTLSPYSLEQQEWHSKNFTPLCALALTPPQHKVCLTCLSIIYLFIYACQSFSVFSLPKSCSCPSTMTREMYWHLENLSLTKPH